MPAFAYCMYSKLGQEAFRVFLRSGTSLGQILRDGAVKNPLRALGFLVFQVEGAFLDKAVTFSGSYDILRSADAAEFTSLGLNPRDLAQLHCLTVESLPLINLARHAVSRDECPGTAGWNRRLAP